MKPASFLAILGRAGVAAVLSASPALPKTLTISWWGFNGEKLTQFQVDPFKLKCGCDIVFETGNNADRLNKLKIRDGEGVDLIYLTDAYSQLGIDAGLFKRFDASKVPNLARVYDMGKDPQGGYGPAYTVGRVGIIYDSAKIKTPITSWNDIWRDDMKGQLSLPGITTTAGPMMVLIAGAHAGVDPYTDEDGSFKAIEELKPSIVKSYNNGSELVNLFSTGEISVAVAQDFTLKQIQAAVPTAVWANITDGAYATLDTLNIPKGAANTDLAYSWVNYILSLDIQQVSAEQGIDAPIRKDVKLTEEQAKQWAYGADMIASLQQVDYKKLNAAKPGWIDRWNEVFGQ